MADPKRRYFEVNTSRQPSKNVVRVPLSVQIENAIIANTSIRIVTNSTTELTTDDMIVCNKATVMGVQLLAATGSKRTLQIGNINDGAVTVTPDGADTINGEATQIIYRNSCMDITDYAANKWIIT